MKMAVQGAEARVFEADYLGEPVVVKERVPKKYRAKELDERIRRERTKQECILLHRAKEAGVSTPCIYKVDRRGRRIFMEKVEGKLLKDIVGGPAGIAWCQKLGEAVARLHGAGIVHGDLTTGNVLVRGEELVLVDFGLGGFSERVEDFAVDLLVFKKTFLATHPSLEKGWEAIVDGYRAHGVAGKAEAVLKQLPEVEARVRYH